jgi:multidrug resistance efflux pump
VQRPAADAALDQANATLATAECDLARSKELVAQGFVSAGGTSPMASMGR